MNADERRAVERRIGKDHLEHRLAKEAAYHETPITLGYWKIRFGTSRKVMRAIETILKWTRLFEIGRRNLLDFRVVEHRARLARLPEAFRGYRILHISDLHIEAFPDAGSRLKEIVRSIPADLLVITGDFRYENWGTFDEAMGLLGRLLEGLSFPSGMAAVLGNHDSIEMVPHLERMGVRVLLNEAVPIRRGDHTIRLCGVDDPHFFELHDLDKAFQGIGPDEFKVLLAHSPDIAELAASYGVDYYLCGHSHGGQICLPGEVPIMANLRVSRRLFRGAWRHGRMEGYTSSGSGASGVPVRFFSRPEVTLHLMG